MSNAFGGPGIEATWTSSAKDFVTTAIGGASRVWLTLGHGIANEIYWPSTGEPQTRDVGFIVISKGQAVEVKRANNYRITSPAPGILAPTVEHLGDGWTLRLDWMIDPDRDTVLVDYELTGEAESLYLLVAPHLGTGTSSNTAWVDRDLHAVADQAEAALSVACAPNFEQVSAGFVGESDGWQDLMSHGSMEWNFDRAAGGNVALTGKLPLSRGLIAIGFATTTEGSSTLARDSLAAGRKKVKKSFVDGWAEFSRHVQSAGVSPKYRSLAEHSASVLACHEDHTFPGATVASLSVPWGDRRLDLGGYHLVWARDCVEAAFGRLAMGEGAAAERTLAWLCAAQQVDGHWTQNAYPDGRPFWTGVQLDEVALPILLAAAVIHPTNSEAAIAQMVRSATRFLVEHGPVSPQDRWEENAGINAFTLAVVISALVAAGPWLNKTDRDYALSLADYWNERIEDWLYVHDGELCEGRNISGYYVRMGDPGLVQDSCGRVDVRNHLGLQMSPEQLIACDFLALTRFGLRSPGDQRIVDSVALIDDLLAVTLPTGVAYHRYNQDGYGEHADGSPFDGDGIGRPWPLLAGERGHYAAQAGDDYSIYLDSMQQMTGPGQLLPEQVWDADPIPERFLEPGHPTGSAMPLAWAHAEFAKLATYRMRGRPIEQSPAVVERFLADDHSAKTWHWRMNAKFDRLPPGRTVLIDHHESFTLTIGTEHFPSRPIGIGRHGVNFEAAPEGTTFSLTTQKAGPLGTWTVAPDPQKVPRVPVGRLATD